MGPQNLIAVTCLVLVATMVALHSVVYSAPLNQLDSDKNYITVGLRRLLQGKTLEPGAHDEYVELTDTEMSLISKIYIQWMSSFMHRLSSVMTGWNQHDIKKYPLKIWEFELFVIYWQELNKIHLANETANPMTKELKRFIADTKTTELAQLASRIRDSHKKLVRLLNAIEPMMQKGNREPYEKIRSLLIEAQSSLQEVDPTHKIVDIVDTSPSKLKELLKNFPELEVINKFISEDSW